MPEKKPSDFRYDAGETKVPWAAVGENYNADDVMDVIRFLIQKGDEVIAPAITFIATISFPLSIGAKVVLADVDPRTINMDPADVEKKITKKTKVIIPVHIGG